MGGFYAEQRRLLDTRRDHLARVGMLPQHVEALRMPDLTETPMLAPARAGDLPEKAPRAYAPPALPRLAGVDAPVHELMDAEKDEE